MRAWIVGVATLVFGSIVLAVIANILTNSWSSWSRPVKWALGTTAIASGIVALLGVPRSTYRAVDPTRSPSAPVTSAAGAPQSGRVEDSIPATRAVIVRRGSAYNGSVCTNSSCRYIMVTGTHYPPHSHQDVKCSSNHGSVVVATTYDAIADALGITVSEACVFGSPGFYVWATVGGVESEHLKW